MNATIIGAALFLVAQLLLLRAARGTSLFLRIHLAFFVTFVTLLHLLYVSSYPDMLRAFKPDLYILAHFISLAYLMLLVALVSLLRGIMPPDETIARTVLGIRDTGLSGIFLAWFAYKAYLGAKYGPFAFVAIRSDVEGGVAFRFDFIDIVTSTYLSHLVIGASAVFALKAAIGGRWPRLVHVGIFVLFLAVYLPIGEAVLGARRFVLLLVLTAIVAASAKWRMGWVTFLRKRWAAILAGVAATIIFSAYFQSVRNNISDPEVASMLISGDVGDMAKGAAFAMIPRMDKGEETTAALREGPFEIIYAISEILVETGTTTHGRITANSLEMVVPYLLSGDEKTTVNTDEIIAEELGITPVGDYVFPDIATNLLAIFLADYGFGGLLISPVVVAMALLAVSLIFRLAKTNTVLKVLTISILFQIAGGVEGDLVAVFANIRDLFLAVVVLTILSGMTRLVRDLIHPVQASSRAQVKRRDEAVSSTPGGDG